jgi:ppGpp synthetase/RelA/SpoT-type nucleotidyltranferase
MNKEQDLREALKNKLLDLTNNNPLNELKYELENRFICSVPGLRVLTRVKELSRALEKIERKGYTSLDQFTDLIGMKIITRNLSDLYSIVEHINRTYNPHSADDYIKKSKITGYKGYHTNFYYKGFNVELQLQTHAMAKASLITHDRLYKQVTADKTAILVSNIKRVIPGWISEPLSNLAQQLIFSAVISFDIIQKQGLRGYRTYLQELKHYSKIDFTPGGFYKGTTSPPYNDIAREKDGEKVAGIQRNIRDMYIKSYPELSYISDAAAEELSSVYLKTGRMLSVSEIKDLRQKLGKDIENGTTGVDVQLFKSLDHILTDLKLFNNNARHNTIRTNDIERDMTDIDIGT